MLMNNDHCKLADISAGCKLADISARCVRWGNNCLYVQKYEKLSEISARPTKNRTMSA